MPEGRLAVNCGIVESDALIQIVFRASYCAVSSKPFSAFSWHSMQCLVHGTASRRFALISLPQETHSPKLPSRMRARAPSTMLSNWRSLLLWLKRNSLLYELAARSATSCVASSSAVRPSFWLRTTMWLSSWRRVSSFFLNVSSFFLSMIAACHYLTSGASQVVNQCEVQTVMVSAKESGRQPGLDCSDINDGLLSVLRNSSKIA